jgi:hypothetical protein
MEGQSEQAAELVKVVPVVSPAWRFVEAEAVELMKVERVVSPAWWFAEAEVEEWVEPVKPVSVVSKAVVVAVMGQPVELQVDPGIVEHREASSVRPSITSHRNSDPVANIFQIYPQPWDDRQQHGTAIL